MKNVLLIGANSAIAEAVARRYAARGARLFLVARDAQRVAALADDLAVRGAAACAVHVLDVNDLAAHAAMLAAAEGFLGRLDVALIAHGTLPDQAACEGDVTLTLAAIQTNALSVIALLTVLANIFASQGGGTLAAISSVAGERGRRSNYVYGAAKAMVSSFLSGLRQRLFARGVRVLTILPGFVDTPMTRQFKKGALWAQPERIAQGIVKAIDAGAPVVWLPHFWFGIMALIRAIPERIFQRLTL